MAKQSTYKGGERLVWCCGVCAEHGDLVALGQHRIRDREWGAVFTGKRNGRRAE